MENNIKLLLLDRMLVLMKTCRRGRFYIVTYIVPYDICTCKCKIHNTILVHMNDPLYMFNRHIMAATRYHRNITEILKSRETLLYIVSYSYKFLKLKRPLLALTDCEEDSWSYCSVTMSRLYHQCVGIRMRRHIKRKRGYISFEQN